MNNGTTQVQFAISDGELEVSAPAALEPLDDFLETEIGTDGDMLELVGHHVRHDRVWRFAGDACQLNLDGETVTVTHNYTDTSTVLTRAEFRNLLGDLRVFLGRR